VAAAHLTEIGDHLDRRAAPSSRAADRAVAAVAWSLGTGVGTPEAGAVLAALEPLLAAESDARAAIVRALDRAERHCCAVVGDAAWLRAVEGSQARARQALGRTLAGRLAPCVPVLEKRHPAAAAAVERSLAEERRLASDLAARARAVRVLTAPWRTGLRGSSPAVQDLRAARRALDDAVADGYADARLRYELVAALAPRAHG
jgi:hypothetical protein